jgi:DNA-binding MarR family transcriptional regulator
MIIRTAEAQALTDVMLTIFRVNGRLLARGDQLSGALGLTSARWQALGAIALSDRPQSVPDVADRMGMTRQGAQKQVNLLEGDGLVEPVPNPRHKRSPLYRLTEAGIAAFEDIDHRHTRWANLLADGMSEPELRNAIDVIESLGARLEAIDPLKASQP